MSDAPRRRGERSSLRIAILLGAASIGLAAPPPAAAAGPATADAVVLISIDGMRWD
ncbi:MAG: hypothetical protein HY510_05915, partial [Acidobacteria bacterium]|nr:hypothetical protein [Acidobacteriota bacterium]